MSPAIAVVTLYIESPSAKSIDKVTTELVFSQIALVDAERLAGVGIEGSTKVLDTTFVELAESVIVTVYVPAAKLEIDCVVSPVFQE